MSLILTAAGLAASAIGSGVQAYQNAKANELAETNYNRQRGQLLTDMYANPLDSVANKALLSQMDRRLEKQNEAVANQAAAGGATFENTLAAKQAGNEAMADVVSGLMQGETARRDSMRQQLLNLDSQRTAQQIAAKQASGAGWASLGDNVSGAFTTLGGTMLENGIPFSELLKFRNKAATATES
jgi:hypothetical protein